jgi:hypothetical protein
MLDNWRGLRWKCVSGSGVGIDGRWGAELEWGGRDTGECEGMDRVGGDGFAGGVLGTI